jgi:hypothetical protein
VSGAEIAALAQIYRAHIAELEMFDKPRPIYAAVREALTDEEVCHLYRAILARHAARKPESGS